MPHCLSLRTFPSSRSRHQARFRAKAGPKVHVETKGRATPKQRASPPTCVRNPRALGLAPQEIAPRDCPKRLPQEIAPRDRSLWAQKKSSNQPSSSKPSPLTSWNPGPSGCQLPETRWSGIFRGPPAALFGPPTVGGGWRSSPAPSVVWEEESCTSCARLASRSRPTISAPAIRHGAIFLACDKIKIDRCLVNQLATPEGSIGDWPAPLPGAATASGIVATTEAQRSTCSASCCAAWAAPWHRTI
jgi:hypothetical protein